MAYCLNPDCSSPQNDSDIGVCSSCQWELTLQAQYIAIAPLASGGFGRTFLAVDQKDPLEACCVIKQSFSERFVHQQNNQLFHQEALQLGQLGKHRQIPELFAYFEQNGFQYLVQEFIDGQDLAQVLKHQGNFPEAEIWQLLKSLLPVLQFIHDHNVIHRDIKPANIIRRQADQQLFLVDMGAARHVTGRTLAMTGTVIGSAEYVAPEQAQGKATFASDIYSLGVTCIHLLTGVSPFSLYDSGDGQWVWRDFLLHPVSDHLGNLLDAMIQLPTNRRYQTCADIEASLVQAANAFQAANAGLSSNLKDTSIVRVSSKSNALKQLTYKTGESDSKALKPAEKFSGRKLPSEETYLDEHVSNRAIYKPDTIDKAYGLLWIAFLLSLVFVI